MEKLFIVARCEECEGYDISQAFTRKDVAERYLTSLCPSDRWEILERDDIVYCSCGLEGIRKSLLEHFNTNDKRFGDYEANNIVITSLAVLDPLSAMQLSSDTCNVIKIEDKYNI